LGHVFGASLLINGLVYIIGHVVLDENILVSA
jgi:hypothetical protein